MLKSTMAFLSGKPDLRTVNKRMFKWFRFCRSYWRLV